MSAHRSNGRGHRAFDLVCLVGVIWPERLRGLVVAATVAAAGAVYIEVCDGGVV